MTRPSALLTRLRDRARQRPARIVLPEGDEPRIVAAAAQARSEGIAEPILLGDPDRIETAARQANVAIDGIACIHPETHAGRASLAQRYVEQRGRDAPSPDEAREMLKDPLLFGTMLLHAGEVAGLLAGARTATKDTIEPALRIRKMRPGLGPIASCFVMNLHPGQQDERTLLFADCALNPEPSPAMLAQIAIAAAGRARLLCEMQPYVALLSFSTHGSADHERTQKVQQALVEVKKRAPDLTVDGELQVDAALVEEVARTKLASSAVAGRANVLIFPSLEAGNIAYKLVERLADARAIGPIFSGLNWPVNDLSRGCSIEDAVDMLAVTSILAST